MIRSNERDIPYQKDFEDLSVPDPLRTGLENIIFKGRGPYACYAQIRNGSGSEGDPFKIDAYPHRDLDKAQKDDHGWIYDEEYYIVENQRGIGDKIKHKCTGRIYPSTVKK